MTPEEIGALDYLLLELARVRALVVEAHVALIGVHEIFEAHRGIPVDLQSVGEMARNPDCLLELQHEIQTLKNQVTETVPA